jgi:cobalamin biosynthesis protein CbiG
LKVLGVHGVAEPCALLGAGGGRLLMKKVKCANMTVAVAQKPLPQLIEERGVADD